MARRRRALFHPFCHVRVIASKIRFFSCFVFLFSALGSGLKHISLPVSLLLTVFDDPSCLKIQHATSGSDQFMGLSQRLFILTPLKNAPWIEDVLGSLRGSDVENSPPLLSVEEILPNVFSSVCFLRSILVSPIYRSRRFRSSPIFALMLQHQSRPTSLSSFALPPPPVLNLSCKASEFLGFPLMGLIHYGPLRSFSWANFFRGDLLNRYNWALFVPTFLLIISWNLMSQHSLSTGRGLRSTLVVTWFQVMVDLYPTRSNQVQRPHLLHHPIWLRSTAKALSSGASFTWLRSGFLSPLLETTRMIFQSLYRNGRGHRSWVGLISLRLCWDRLFRTLGHRFCLCIWPYYSIKRRLLCSSRWERSSSPSIAKELSLPLPPTLEVVTPAGLEWSFMKNRAEEISNLSRYPLVVSSPLMAEVLAMRASLETASTLGFTTLVMESDSPRGVLIDIVSLSLSFESCSSSHIPSCGLSLCFNVLCVLSGLSDESFLACNKPLE